MNESTISTLAAQPVVTAQTRRWMIGILCVLSAQLLFGTTFAINKLVINQSVDPILLGFNRAVLATLTLLPFYWRRRKSAHWSPADWRRALFIGAGACAAAMILEYMGTRYTTASNVSLIISTEAVFSIFLCVWILKEKLAIATVIGGLAAAAGMGFVLLDDIRGLDVHFESHLFGDLLVLGSVLCWGLYTVNSKILVDRSNATVTIFFVTLFSALSLGGINLFRGTLGQIGHMPTPALLGTVYLGVFCSGFAHLLYFQALQRLPASLVALTLTLLPVFGVVFSIALLGERLTWAQGAGAVVIIVGIGYAVWPRNRTHTTLEQFPPGQ
ncbi:MAG TPA: DMT family transporter [bacterium]|nr:DMT family transporter [Candidatus Omnitrophota bacterium]HOJ61711.1 DMT family transporter [bacterium]HOL94993.1 DMT family transporter [bacterium]HPP01938.1 DMT family transporter [bacterium]HXK92985.1 DMT family transporter [bacterium]